MDRSPLDSTTPAEWSPEISGSSVGCRHIAASVRRSRRAATNPTDPANTMHSLDCATHGTPSSVPLRWTWTGSGSNGDEQTGEGGEQRGREKGATATGVTATAKNPSATPASGRLIMQRWHTAEEEKKQSDGSHCMAMLSIRDQRCAGGRQRRIGNAAGGGPRARQAAVRHHGRGRRPVRAGRQSQWHLALDGCGVDILTRSTPARSMHSCTTRPPAISSMRPR